MSFAYLVGGVILAETASLPEAARRLDTDEWVIDLDAGEVDVQEAAGWYLVTDTPRPPDTATTTQDRTLVLVAGVPTVQWTERAKTQPELDTDTNFANVALLTADATTNINTLLASITALNAITALTNATINANPAVTIKDVVRECKTIARQTVRIARLVTGSTMSTDTGT